MTDVGTVAGTGTAPHLLYVAWGYPPSRSAGMYRALATANAFARAGWDVTVLTATRETYERLTGSDPQSEDAIDSRITVVRIPFDPLRGEPDLRKWSRWRVLSPLLWNYLRWVRARFGFPEAGYGMWKAPLIEAARQIHATHPVSLVVGTANPNVNFTPGEDLHRSHGVPYVMDHRDAWQLDVYTGERTSPRTSRPSRLEERLISNALECWFVNQPIRDWHAREHPDHASRMHVVANGYDPNFLDTSRTRTPDPSHLIFGFLGTVYGPIPLRETFEAWRAARAISPLLASAEIVIRGRLGHFAEPDPIAAQLIAEFADDGVRYEGPVSKTGVADVYRSFDALLLVISASKFVTSGKVFEYAATGLPIAAIHDPETAATSILTGHPSWFPVAGVTHDEIVRVLISTAERAAAMSTADFAEAQQWATPLARDNQLAPRIAVLAREVTPR